LILILKPGREPSAVLKRLAELDHVGAPSHVDGRWLVAVESRTESGISDRLRAHRDVETVQVSDPPYRLVARERCPEGSLVDVGPVTFGGADIVLIAGPCSVEDEEQLLKTATLVAEAGATMLRGGAYKPSTSPYGFQGLGIPGLTMLREAGRRVGLGIVTEVMDPAKVERVAEFADMLQIGARSMQNFDLLKAVGRCGKPVLLKRGMCSTLDEWLLAAEYVADAGNERIVLCERGIRSFDASTRNVLDLAAVPAIRQLSCLPIVVDPSHGTGRRDLVGPMAKASLAAGADGLLIEVHPDPDRAIKDGGQSLSLEEFGALVPELERIAPAVDRRLPSRSPVVSPA